MLKSALELKLIFNQKIFLGKVLNYQLKKKLFFENLKKF